jgi:stage V sporulation protein B
LAIDKFYKDSLVLTASNMVTGLISFVFSIIISRKLGAEGLGLYSLIMPIYVLMLCITSEGLATAISKISAIYSRINDYKNLNKTLSTLFFFVFFWALAVALVSFLLSSDISIHIIKDKRAADAIKIISPAIVFVPLSQIFKGFLYGTGKFNTAAYIDISEKSFRVFVLLGTIALFSLKEVKSIVTAAYLSLAIGEFTSLLLFYIMYKNTGYRKLTSSHRAKSRIQLIFDVLVVSIPLGINGFITSVISTFSTLLLPRRLVVAGFTYSNALALIGRFSGMALTVVYLPYIAVNSMLIVLIPDLSIKINSKDSWAIENRIMQVIKISILVGIATGVVCLSIPDILGQLFFKRSDLEEMIKFAALAGFTNYVASPSFGILNALGKQQILLRNSVLVALEELALIYFLTSIPNLNIYGYGICIMISSITAFYLNITEISKDFEIQFQVSEIITFVVIAILAFLLVNLLLSFISPLHPIIIAVLITSLAFYLVYYMAKFTEILE